MPAQSVYVAFQLSRDFRLRYSGSVMQSECTLKAVKQVYGESLHTLSPVRQAIFLTCRALATNVVARLV